MAMASEQEKTTSLRETDIRPDHLMAEQARLFALDVARLLERRDEFVRVSCPACDASTSRPVFEKQGFCFEECPECGTTFTNPRPTPEILDFYYETSENYKYWNKMIFPASEDARRERIFRPRVDRVLEFCRRFDVEFGTFLEVGAGFGTFCEELGGRGIFQRIIAVEPTPDLVRSCRARGVEVFADTIERIRLPEESVDVVASFEVIEHLFRPEEFVSQCIRFLKPGGIVFLTCPNGQGFEVATLKEHAQSVDPEHLNYFNPASLSRLLERKGLEILEVTTPGKLDAEIVRKRALSGVLDLSEQPFLRRVLLEEWERLGDRFQTFLGENVLSSHMWIVARKG